MYRNQRKIHNATCSLKEYLAYQSVHNTQPEDEPLFPTETTPSDEDLLLEIEIDVGQGRLEVVEVRAGTNVRVEANKFCTKYGLSEEVEQLLTQSMEAQLGKELQRMELEKLQEHQQLMRDIYANTQTRQIILVDDGFVTKNESEKKGTGGVLRGGCGQSKRNSLPQNLLNNKENRQTINKLSQEICARRGKKNIIESRNQRSREKMAALVREREQKQIKEMEECFFRPKINAISKKVTDHIDKTAEEGHRFDQLYQEHRNIQLKKEEERENAIKANAFRPKIDSISEAIIENKRKEGTLGKSLTKKHPCAQSQDKLRNPKTGRKPVSRNIQKLPIGEYLYNQSRRPKARPSQPTNDVKALEHSDYLVSILKEKRINEMFTELTQAPHELLTVDDIGYRKFHEGPSRYFKPIFNEMIEMDVSLNREEFMETALLLLQTLTPQEKHDIILKKEKDLNNKNGSTSMVNSRSREILRKSGCYGGDIYSRGVEQRLRAEWKVEQNKERRVRQELSQCTFRPTLRRLL